jgi:hypothetical protein
MEVQNMLIIGFYDGITEALRIIEDRRFVVYYKVVAWDHLQDKRIFWVANLPTSDDASCISDIYEEARRLAASQPKVAFDPSGHEQSELLGKLIELGRNWRKSVVSFAAGNSLRNLSAIAPNERQLALAKKAVYEDAPESIKTWYDLT